MKKFIILMSLILTTSSAFAESVTFSAEQIKKIETHITSLNTQIQELTDENKTLTERNKTQAKTIKELMEKFGDKSQSENADEKLKDILGAIDDAVNDSEVKNQNNLELVLTAFKRGEYAWDSRLILNVKNNTDKEIVAWSANITCVDTLGNQAFKMGLRSASANIQPGKIESSQFEPGWGEAEDTVRNNKSKNFDCSLSNVKISQK